MGKLGRKCSNASRRAEALCSALETGASAWDDLPSSDQVVVKCFIRKRHNWGGRAIEEQIRKWQRNSGSPESAAAVLIRNLEIGTTTWGNLTASAKRRVKDQFTSQYGSPSKGTKALKRRLRMWDPTRIRPDRDSFFTVNTVCSKPL